MSWETILFDLDGTLTDPAEGITKAVAYALERHGRPVSDLDTLTPFIGPPLLDSFVEISGFSRAEAGELVRDYRVYFSRQGIFENRVYEGIPQMLQRLREMGKVLVVATSKPEEFARRILERFDLAQYFTHICGATMDESRTSKGAVIAYALETAGVADPARVLMVGDRKHDIKGAAQNGIQSLGVLFGYGSREELEAAGADYIVDSVPALEELLAGL